MKISDNFNFLELSFSDFHYTDNRAGSPMHYLAYMKKGRVKLEAEDGTAVSVGEGDIFFIPYKLPYRSYWYGDPEIICLSLGFLNTEAAEKIDFELQRVACDEELGRRVAQIPADGARPRCGTLSMFYGVLSDLIPYLKSRSRTSRAQEVTDLAKKYILQHTECTVAEVAGACFVSEPYLFACFREKACCTPNEYRLKAIARKGREYLLSTDKSVEEVAALVGLSSAAHLRRLLKKYTGLTPREIRRSCDF